MTKREREVRRTVERSIALDYERLRALFWEGCRHCTLDMGEGALLNHCDACCRKLTKVLGLFVRRQPLPLDMRSLKS